MQEKVINNKNSNDNNKKDFIFHEKENISYSNELIRKLIHLLSLTIPIVYIFVSKQLALSVLIPMALFTIILDILSKSYPFFSMLREKTFGKIMRPAEKDKKSNMPFNGASWVLISSCIIIAIFPKFVSIVSFSILIISDLSAALIGRKYGKRVIYGTDKSLEGSIAFIIAGIAVITIYGLVFELNSIYYLVAVFAVIGASIAEAYSKELGFDDNLLIPFTAGIIFMSITIFFEESKVKFLNLLI